MTDPVKAQVPRLAVAGIYGPDRFGRAAERIVRLFGMSRFLVGQTVVIAAWVIVSKTGFGPRFDPYPFIFLNMVFSALAAYAAQLILLAETRQADRDKILAKTEARHRAGADSRLAEDNRRRTAQTVEPREQGTRPLERQGEQTALLWSRLWRTGEENADEPRSRY